MGLRSERSRTSQSVQQTQAPSPHHPGCFGCGPQNDRGLRLLIAEVEFGIAAKLTFDECHVGSPGVVHLGAIAASFTELFTLLKESGTDPRVLRSTKIDYIAPVVPGAQYTVEARIQAIKTRTAHLVAGMTDLCGRTVAVATADYVVCGD